MQVWTVDYLLGLQQIVLCADNGDLYYGSDDQHGLGTNLHFILLSHRLYHLELY